MASGGIGPAAGGCRAKVTGWRRSTPSTKPNTPLQKERAIQAKSRAKQGRKIGFRISGPRAARCATSAEAHGRGQQDQDEHQPAPPACPPSEGVELQPIGHGRKTAVHVSVRGRAAKLQAARSSTGFLPSGSKSMNRRQLRFQGRAST